MDTQFTDFRIMMPEDNARPLTSYSKNEPVMLQSAVGAAWTERLV
jgi:hypothetical protein